MPSDSSLRVYVPKLSVPKSQNEVIPSLMLVYSSVARCFQGKVSEASLKGSSDILRKTSLWPWHCESNVFHVLSRATLRVLDGH